MIDFERDLRNCQDYLYHAMDVIRKHDDTASFSYTVIDRLDVLMDEVDRWVVACEEVRKYAKTDESKKR